MTSQEEVIQPDNVAKVRQDVAKPGDQPAESKDCTHLSSDKARKRHQDNQLQYNTGKQSLNCSIRKIWVPTILNEHNISDYICSCIRGIVYDEFS